MSQDNNNPHFPFDDAYGYLLQPVEKETTKHAIRLLCDKLHQMALCIYDSSRNDSVGNSNELNREYTATLVHDICKLFLYLWRACDVLLEMAFWITKEIHNRY